MQKTNLKVSPENCVLCQCCQLICSLTWTGAFNPEKACLILSDVPEKIVFTDECRKGCTLCGRYCRYHAIERL